MQTIVKPHL